MEPMNLGSPGSSALNPNTYLPAFLMGETQEPSTPRSNTLSPNKTTRNISFGATSLSEYNHPTLGQRNVNNFPLATKQKYANSIQSPNTSISGPPTQGLFDIMHKEPSTILSPTRLNASQQQLAGHQSFQNFGDFHSVMQTSFNEPRGNHTPLNISRPLQAQMEADDADVMGFHANDSRQHAFERPNEFWVTIFGFPPSSITTILQHFGECGTIVDKVFPPQSGNWIHIRYSSRLECDKALTFNEKIINNLMVGVTHCKSKDTDKGNINENTSVCKVRPLAQVAYNASHQDLSVTDYSTSQKSNGILSKAVDLIFGW